MHIYIYTLYFIISSARTYDHDVVEFFDGHVWPMYLEMESKVTSFQPSGNYH